MQSIPFNISPSIIGAIRSTYSQNRYQELCLKDNDIEYNGKKIQ